MEDKIFIVCGYGSVGRKVCKALKKRYRAYIIVVDKDLSVVPKVFEDGFDCYEGDATSSDILLQAGIKSADGIICTFASDETNALAILTAKWLNPGIPVISRVNKLQSVTKLRLAGATKVVSFSGFKNRLFNIADNFLNNNLFIFSLANFERNPHLAEIAVSNYYYLQNKQLLTLKEISDMQIIALKKSGGEVITKPSQYEKTAKHDVIVLLSEKEAIKYLLSRLKQLSYYYFITHVLEKVFIKKLTIYLASVLISFNYFVLFDNFLNWIVLPAPPFTMGHIAFASSTIIMGILILIISGKPDKSGNPGNEPDSNIYLAGFF